MKIKARLRRFWRHNKKCGGMWAMLIQIVVIALPPYNIGTILFLLIAGLWGAVWMKEREVMLLRRCFDIRERQFRNHYDWLHKTYHEALCKLEEAHLDTLHEQEECYLDAYCMTCCNIHEKDCLAVDGECKQHAKLIKRMS